jgi:hypothetical protein
MSDLHPYAALRAENEALRALLLRAQRAIAAEVEFDLHTMDPECAADHLIIEIHEALK